MTAYSSDYMCTRAADLWKGVHGGFQCKFVVYISKELYGKQLARQAEESMRAEGVFQDRKNKRFIGSLSSTVVLLETITIHASILVSVVCRYVDKK